MSSTAKQASGAESAKSEKSAENANSRSGRQHLILLSVGSFSLLAILLLFSGEKTANAFSEAESMVMQNASVEVQEIMLQNAYSKQRKVYGLIESATQATIGFELSGVINELYVKEGDSVAKGQALAGLDLQRLLAQQQELEAALTRAQADANLAKLSNNRIAELVKSKLESSQRLDEAEANLDAANAAVNEVIARQERLAVEIEKSTLKAPFDGQVVSQILDPGTVVSSGQGVFSILSQQRLEARIGLPTNSPLALKIGEVYPLNFNGQVLNSRLSSIAKQRNRATRAIDAVFAIESVDLEQTYIMPGDIVSLSVDVDVQHTGAWVPVAALANGVRGLWTLFIVSEVDGKQIVQPRSVQVEYMEQDRAFVSGAIEQGDKLIVSGLQRFTPNQAVNNVSVKTVTGR
ncbi:MULTISPECIES: efflux RND transporter periplasmic adaptor subunit [Alteromonadaceae]|uniref:Efflux RND transporter periplasmic adaptor subunit n=1 Tax=Brumicola blandensis TaxID=3075611 RepID=A0AAW8R2J6_9ALTE|nr:MULTISPECIES: efflux RND transporter periplasmic adaptor subunit [unclassified Alteromonas]MDT0582310.1 efflux RND transporter periplasmic adaptor subunit [Alteromonas sp. W409]MDT0628531.1 efflux RND transporter periplasmic adaptor subunit [Alteromonas sp. W364]